MSGAIRLDTVLKEATQTDYRDLVTRPTGAAVRDRLVSTLLEQDRTEALLDFSRIGLVDFSCADEVVAKLIFALRDLPVSRVVLRGVREDQAEAIEHALSRHGLAVLALEEGSSKPLLLGVIDDDCRTVFAILETMSRITIESVAGQLGWQEARVRTALGRLVLCRCIVVNSDDSYELGAFT